VTDQTVFTFHLPPPAFTTHAFSSSESQLRNNLPAQLTDDLSSINQFKRHLNPLLHTYIYL